MFYIWFGNTKPKYTDMVINQFKKHNPDFKVDLITYNVNQLNDLQSTNDDLLIQSDEIVRKRHRFITGERSYIIEMCDVYRFLLIDKYGGFYSDLDMFTIRKIPHTYLYKEKIMCTIMYNPYITQSEIGFFGMTKLSERKKQYITYYTVPFGGYIQDDKDPYFIDRKNKFYNCCLTDDDYIEFKKVKNIQQYQIFEHFATHSWHNTDLTNKDIYINK